MLLLALALLSITAVVALGSTALEDTIGQAQGARAGQSMTVFDAQAAQVALGESSVQTTEFGHSDGNYHVNSTAGEISLLQLDCDDNGVNDDGDDRVTNASATNLTDDDDAYVMEPTDLGALVYQEGSTTVAYQGGGVWRKTAAGADMISRPEFYYEGATLTFPVVLTRGSGSQSGAVAATARSAGSSTPVFPNATATFPGRCEETGATEAFENPLVDGTVVVRVESAYADAWGRYFEARTKGKVRYPAEGVVLVELVSLGQVGDFGMPGEGGSITVSGTADAHSTEAFNITLRPDDADAANFNNLQWSMYAEEGETRFEMHLTKSGNNGCADGTTDISADLDLYYSNDGGDTYQAWHGADAFEAGCADFDDDGDHEIYLTVDLVDDTDGDGRFVDVESGDSTLTYTDKSGLDGLLYYSIQGDDTAIDPVTLDGHGDWEAATYHANTGDAATVDRLVNHYFAELPAEFQLTVDDKGSDTVSEGSSAGRLVVGGSARYINYLHITKKRVTVELN